MKCNTPKTEKEIVTGYTEVQFTTSCASKGFEIKMMLFSNEQIIFK